MADASVTFDTSVDNKGFVKGLRDAGRNVDALTKALEVAEKSVQNQEKAVAKLKKRYEEAAFSVSEFRKAGDYSSKEYQSAVDETKRLSKQLSDAENVLGNMKKDVDSLSNALARARESAVFDFAEQAKVAEADIAAMEQRIKDLYSQLDKERDASSFIALRHEITASEQALESFKAKLSEPVADIMAVRQLEAQMKTAQGEVQRLESLIAMEKDPVAITKLRLVLIKAENDVRRLDAELFNLKKTTQSAVDERPVNRFSSALKRAASGFTSTLGKIPSQIGRGVSALAGLVGKMKLFNKETKRAGSAATDFGQRLFNLVRAAFVFNVIRRGLAELRKYLGSLLRTNTDFVASLNSVKVNLATAFQPIYEAILPALNALMSVLATVTAHVAAFISMLFGKTYTESRAAAKALNSQAEALKNTGSAAKNAAKNLQGFDQINRLAAEGAEDAGGTGGAGELSALFDEAAIPEIDTTAWDKFLSLLQPTTDALQRLKEVLAPFKEFVFQGLYDFYNNFLVPVASWVLGEGLPRFIDGIGWIVKSVNWGNLNAALNSFWMALSPFAIKIGEGLLWFWENVLSKFIAWAVGNLVPAAINLLSKAIDVLDSIITAAAPAFTWFWEEILKPAAEWTGEMIIKALGWLSEKLTDLSDWIKNNQELVTNFIKIVGLIVGGFLAAQAAVKVFNGALTAIKIVLAVLSSPAGVFLLVVAAIAAIVTAAGNAGEMIESLKSIFSGFGKFISGVFAGDWKRAWEGIKDIFKGVINSIIIILESALNLIIRGINGLLSMLNKVKFDIPDWVPAIGGQSFGFNIPKIPDVNIPRLAQGGLIAPNNPRAVIVGDNTREEEIISPRSAIREEVKNALSEMGGGNAELVSKLDTLIEIMRRGQVIEVDGKTLGRTTGRNQSSLFRQYGKTLIPV